MFGPYYKRADDDLWHWVKSCPEFPEGKNVQAMVGTQKPDPKKLCKQCSEIEINSFKSGLDSVKK